MAEIRSTLELVMEKTKDLVLTEDEKRAIERTERVEKVAGYVDRYLQGEWTTERLETEIAELSARYERDVITRVWQCLLDRFDFEKTGEKCLEALELFVDKKTQPCLTELKSMWLEYHREHKQWLHDQQAKLMANLAMLGISGNAIVPRSPKDPAWLERQQTFAQRLADLRRDCEALVR